MGSRFLIKRKSQGEKSPQPRNLDDFWKSSSAKIASGTSLYIAIWSLATIPSPARPCCPTSFPRDRFSLYLWLIYSKRLHFAGLPSVAFCTSDSLDIHLRISLLLIDNDNYGPIILALVFIKSNSYFPLIHFTYDYINSG